MEKDKLLHFIACETIALVATIISLILGCGDYSFPIAFVVGGASGGTDDFTAGSMQPLLTVKYGTI